MTGKRWRSVILLMLLSSVLCSACGGDAHTLVLDVTEVYENAFMAQVPFEKGAFAQGDKLYVSCENLPALSPGDRVEVLFNGIVMTSEPAQIVADAVVHTALPAQENVSCETEETAR